MLSFSHFPEAHRPDIFPEAQKQYIRRQSYANAIWSRWLREYVPALNKRNKSYSDSDGFLKTGGLVWVDD